MWKKEKKKKVLILIDFENLMISLQNTIGPIGFSIEAGFNRVIAEITTAIGEIIGVFAFLPPDRAMVWSKDLYRLGFTTILCPRIKDKEGVDQDTTDTTLMKLGEWLMENLTGLTHICIGSGDKDFGPLMRKGALKGLKRMVIAANLSSLSSELIKLTDSNPLTGKKMVYLFVPIE